ncbi:hypothetical protein GCM10027037_35230 [Mucilaginibacter koreensis]
MFLVGHSNVLYSVNKKAQIATTMLFFALLLNAASEQQAILQVATLLSITAISIMLGVVARQYHNKKVRYTLSFLLFAIFIIIQLIHNIVDSLYGVSLSKADAVSLANPWGLVSSFALIYCCNFNGYDLSYFKSYKFIRLIKIASMVLCLVMIGVATGLISGNTSKVAEDLGGIGLKGASTNETALFAVCLSIHLLVYARKTKFDVFTIICLVANLFVVVLTQSRTGLFAVVFLLSMYFLAGLRRNLGASIAIAFLAAIIVIPSYDYIANVISTRFQHDENNANFVTVSDNLGFTLSGRTLIWEGYLDEFFKSLEHNAEYLYVGSGFNKLVDLYNQSFIPLLNLGNLKVNFYPLHSDLLLIFITGGIIGLLAWAFQLYTVIKNLIREPKFIFGAFLMLLIVYTAIDMLNYSPLSSLLIGVGLSQKSNFA